MLGLTPEGIKKLGKHFLRGKIKITIDDIQVNKKWKTGKHSAVISIEVVDEKDIVLLRVSPGELEKGDSVTINQIKVKSEVKIA